MKLEDIIVFTTARHMSFSKLDQSSPCSHILLFKIHFNIILQHMPRPPEQSLSFTIPHQNSYPNTWYMSHSFHPP